MHTSVRVVQALSLIEGQQVRCGDLIKLLLWAPDLVLSGFIQEEFTFRVLGRRNTKGDV